MAQPQTQTSRLPEPGDFVVLPTGTTVKVIEIYDGIGEVLVEWTESGERGQFRMGVLKPRPKGRS